MNYIYKDYYIDNGILCKDNIKESKHLMWFLGGVPCIDAVNVWDKFKDNISEIRIKTDRGNIYSTTKDIFEESKKVLDKGFGVQYYIDKDKWKITK